MTKKLLIVGIVMMFLSLMVAGCNEDLSVWTMTGQDTDLLGRVGLVDNGTEVFVTAKYDRTSDIEWGPEPDVVGGGVIFHLTQEVTIEDTPEPSPIKDWLEALHAQPYAGMEIVGRLNEDTIGDVQPNWIAGSKFKLNEDSNYALIVEYLDGDQASGDVYLGLMGRF